MKVSVETKSLLKALKAALLLTKKPSVDALKNCRLIAENNFLNISALYFDSNVSIAESGVVTCNIKLPCDVYEDGMVLVNCDDLYKFVMSQKKSKEITISTSDLKDWSKYADISAGTLKATLKQGDPTDYPEFNRFEFNVHDNGVTVQADRFIKAINRVKGCLSKDSSRQEFCNYFIDVTDNDVCLFATNGHALSVDRLPIIKYNSLIKFNKTEFGNIEYINIDPKSLDLVMQMFEDSAYLELYKKGECFFITDYISYVVVKFREEALDYKQFTDMNLGNYHKFSVVRDSLKQAVKNVSAGVSKINTIGLNFNSDNLKVFTKENFAKYELSDIAGCNPENNFANTNIGVNYKYLLNAIDKMDDKLYFFVEDRYSPMFIYNQNSSRYLQVVMPMEVPV